jgi:hypothetical protein
MTKAPVWIIFLCPLILIFLACLVFGPGAVSAVFDAVFDGIAWVVLVWLVLLGLV